MYTLSIQKTPIGNKKSKRTTKENQPDTPPNTPENQVCPQPTLKLPLLTTPRNDSA